MTWNSCLEALQICQLTFTVFLSDKGGGGGTKVGQFGRGGRGGGGRQRLATTRAIAAFHGGGGGTSFKGPPKTNPAPNFIKVDSTLCLPRKVVKERLVDTQSGSTVGSLT